MNINNSEPGGPSSNDSFFLGVEDTFALTDSNDIVVIGKVHGTIRTGSTFYISNLGDDDTPTSLTRAAGLAIDQLNVDTATDQQVAVRVEMGSKLNIKTGSVLFTRDIMIKDVHDAYISALGDGYISFKHMKLEQSDYDKMSLTDLAEVRRLYKWLIDSKKEQETKERNEYNKLVFDTIGHQMCNKILSSKEIYTVINKKTGEPHMVSHTYKQDNNSYITTPPDIILITKAYLNLWKNQFPEENFDIIRIDNGQDCKGIYNFLGSTFYLNGACGVTVLFNDYSIDAGILVEKPDYSNIPPVQVPVTNPDLERWLLLIAQLDTPETEDEKQLHSIYLNHIFTELAHAKFIIPMKVNQDDIDSDDTGKGVFKKDSQIAIAIRPGKEERNAVSMFTDWKRFRMVYKEDDGWNGLIQPISGMIDSFDCAINATEHNLAGCYIDRNFYIEHIKPFETHTDI